MGRKAVEMTGSSENLSAKKGKKEVRLKKKKKRELREEEREQSNNCSLSI